MVIVLVAARFQKILSWIQTIQDDRIMHIGVMKQNGPTLYLYVETSLSYHDVVRIFHHCIHQSGGMSYVYQFYSIYHGMIDYSDYLSEETKNKMKYYQSEHKDVQDYEIEQYQKEHF